jgi:hypothetical protein
MIKSCKARVHGSAWNSKKTTMFHKHDVMTYASKAMRTGDDQVRRPYFLPDLVKGDDKKGDFRLWRNVQKT